MNIKSSLTKAAKQHLETDEFELIEMEKDVPLCLDCSWETDDGTEKRVRILQEDEDELPKVMLCSDYVDERNSFGILVLNERIDADTDAEHLRIALNRIFSQTK